MPLDALAPLDRWCARGDRSDPAGPRKGGPDGQLDGFDLVIHMGHPRLVIEPLSAQSPATIDVLRWRDQK